MPDPLLDKMKVMRLRQHMSQRQVAGCMGIATGSYRHIEKGRRSLPDVRHGLVKWMRQFQNCVNASPEERRELMNLLANVVLYEFSLMLDDYSGTTDPAD